MRRMNDEWHIHKIDWTFLVYKGGWDNEELNKHSFYVNINLYIPSTDPHPWTVQDFLVEFPSQLMDTDRAVYGRIPVLFTLESADEGDFTYHDLPGMLSFQDDGTWIKYPTYNSTTGLITYSEPAFDLNWDEETGDLYTESATVVDEGCHFRDYVDNKAQDWYGVNASIYKAML